MGREDTIVLSRYLVCGATGFIGSHLCERLLADGHTIAGLSRGRDMHNLAGIRKHERFTFICQDLRAWIPPLGTYDAVVHLAARAGLVKSWTETDEYIDCNIKATRNLLERCQGSTPRFVYISSSSVYGPEATGPEESLLQPSNPYGCTKLAAEWLVKAYHERGGPEWTIIRPFSIYGPRQREDMAHNIFIRKLLKGEPITVDWDGQQARCNTYVTDLVDGIVRSLSPSGRGEAFNIGGGETVSISETIRILEELTGIKAVLQRGPKRDGDQRVTRANIAKATRLLGYEPRVRLREGLANQVEWQRETVCV